MELMDLFVVSYDKDRGDWILSVRTTGPSFVRHYPTEIDARLDEIRLKHRLSYAPRGDVLAVLTDWELEG